MNIYHEWIPMENIPSRLYCEGLYDDYEGFRVLLKGEETNSRQFQICFESVLAYRNIDEGDRLRTLHELPMERKVPLFIVEESSFIRWFHEESCDIHRNRDVKHYAIYTSNDCIDVISSQVPLVAWSEK